MLNRRRLVSLSTRLLAAATLGATTLLSPAGAAVAEEPLKIGYSDWPGWVAWEIGIQKGWFEEAGVDVEFLWFDYVASMDAYVAGQIDAVTMTNGDALVTGGTGKPSVTILINDFSNGNDMLVVKPDVPTVAALKGKKIGVEVGFVGHLLAITGLQMAGVSPDDVEFVDTPTDQTPSVLANGDVSAIAAWQPNSGEALKAVEGARALFTSADAPGIIYDVLAVSPESLETRRDDWMKVIGVWYRIVEYINDEDNTDEALEILSARVNISPREYEPFFEGTYILNLEEAMQRWQKGDSLESIYGSSEYVNAFNVEQGVYEAPLNVDAYHDPSLMEEFFKANKP